MVLQIAFVQLIVFFFFFSLERLIPHHNHPIPKQFGTWWTLLAIYSLVWLRVLFYFWVNPIDSVFSINFSSKFAEGILFYVIYSFGNYWLHRWKHSNRFLWLYIHRLHHSPSHMDSRLAFYRHPTEILFNTIYIVLLGKFCLNISVEALAIALAIEGCLECFHHSNIYFPKKWRWLGYVVQLPGMHLVHHEYGLHRYNYAPFLWDWVFSTINIPNSWDKKLGFKQSHIVTPFVFLRKGD